MKIIFQSAAAIFLLSMATKADALGREISYASAFENYSAAIESVINCGDWQAGTQQGSFRLVQLEMYAQSFLYVDQKTYNENGEALVSKGMGFVEFNNDHAQISLSKVSCQVKKNALHIKARAEFVEGPAKNISVVVSLDGKYSIKGL